MFVIIISVQKDHDNSDGVRLNLQDEDHSSLGHSKAETKLTATLKRVRLRAKQ